MGWVLVAEASERSLGAALVWAAHGGVEELHLLVDAHGPTLAARAEPFSLPVSVWVIDGSDLRPAPPGTIGDAPSHCAPSRPSAAQLALFGSLGLETVEEHGIVRAELLGLEVARIVDGELRVGVGRFDREMAAMLHEGLQPGEALERVVEVVGRHRRHDAPPHPLRDLCPERWLRCELLERPEGVGAGLLEPVAAVTDRPSLRDPFPALAVDRERGVLVACTHGVDVDAIPLAAASLAEGHQLVVASNAELPRSVRTVGGWLPRPARFVVPHLA